MSDITSLSEIKKFFIEDSPDNRILALAYHLINNEHYQNVIIVSKDINLRMKAKSLGIPAEDYITGTVRNIDELYTGKRILEDISPELIEMFYNPPFEIDLDKFILPVSEIYPNEYFILKSIKNSVLVRYDVFNQKIIKVDKKNAYGIKPRNAEQTFAMDALMDNNIPIVTLAGKAGTGKTLLALACAIEKRSDYKQIFLQDQ